MRKCEYIARTSERVSVSIPLCIISYDIKVSSEENIGDVRISGDDDLLDWDSISHHFL